MTTSREVKLLSVRLPVELNTWLKHRAIDDHRTANGEPIAILTAVRDADAAARATPKGVDQ